MKNKVIKVNYILSLISTFSLTSCYQYNTRVVLDDVIYYLHDYKNIAFSVGANYVGNETEFEVKDVVDGHIVNRLGDSHRRYPFCVEIGYYLKKTENFPELEGKKYQIGSYEIRYIDNEQKKNMSKLYYKIKYFDFTLKFGVNLETIDCVESYCESIFVKGKKYGYIPRYRIECNPDNKTFYSEDGKLYRRENKELVTDFIYYDYQVETS